MEVIGICCIVGVVIVFVSFWVYIFKLEKLLKKLEKEKSENSLPL